MDSRERTAAEEQLRILELLETAMNRRDEVLELVETSEDETEAEERICELFDVRPPISRAVLDISVYRWTRSHRRTMAENAAIIRRLLAEQS
jgi:DNA gyrase/topoisomerase IV subunit A